MNRREEIIRHLSNYFGERASRYGLEMAFLYGSWARGIPKPYSDVDIAVVFSEEPSSDDISFEYVNDLSLILSRELNLEVNVIQIHQDFRKPMLYYNAIVLGVPIYFKRQDKYISLKIEAIHQMEDYGIFGPSWQHEIIRRNLEALRHA